MSMLHFCKPEPELYESVCCGVRLLILNLYMDQLASVGLHL